jgi:hypothetical protein
VIYEFSETDAPIRQGDIFVGLPRVEVSLHRLTVVEDDGAVDTDWAQVLEAGEPVTAILPVRPVTAIVATQDCDSAHSQDITLCEIRNFRDVERKAKDTNNVNGWIKILTQHSRLNLKWFYLPPCERIGFTDKLAVDFTVTIRVSRTELEGMRQLRKGRLNPLADEHFRERISEFFRRYPYDEWYPLSTAELAEYQKRYPEAKGFPWQQNEGVG